MNYCELLLIINNSNILTIIHSCDNNKRKLTYGNGIFVCIGDKDKVFAKGGSAGGLLMGAISRTWPIRADYIYLDNHLKGTSQSQKRMRFVIGG